MKLIYASPAPIIGEVAALTGVPAPAITGKGRSASIVAARYLAIAAVKKHFPWWSCTDLGKALDCHHTTILHATKQHAKMLKAFPEYRSIAIELGL